MGTRNCIDYLRAERNLLLGWWCCPPLGLGKRPETFQCMVGKKPVEIWSRVGFCWVCEVCWLRLDDLQSGVALENPGRAGSGLVTHLIWASTGLCGLTWVLGVWVGYLNNKGKHSDVDWVMESGEGCFECRPQRYSSQRSLVGETFRRLCSR